jgi:hypothetical protein
VQARQIQDDNTQRTDTQRPNRIGSSSKMSATQESQKKTFGKSTREIPHHSQKASKWYPAEDEAQHKKVRYKTQPEPEQEIATRRTARLSSGKSKVVVSGDIVRSGYQGCTQNMDPKASISDSATIGYQRQAALDSQREQSLTDQL